MHPLFDLKNKVALITGGTSGIGLATATVFCELGAKVVVASENLKACRSAETKLKAQGHKNILAIPCDVRQQEQLQELVQKTVSHFGRINTVVCAAGVAPHNGPSATATHNDWHNTMTTNLQSAMWLANMVVPLMQKGGSIIFVASIASVRGNKNIGLYGISKAGLAQLARNLAVEHGPQNIRVNAVSPGLVRTAFAKNMMKNKTIMQKRLALTPLCRVAEAKEIAGIIAMLAAPAGAFVTGQNIIVDGGTVITDGN